METRVGDLVLLLPPPFLPFFLFRLSTSSSSLVSETKGFGWIKFMWKGKG